jgi:hypothetical protein
MNFSVGGPLNITKLLFVNGRFKPGMDGGIRAGHHLSAKELRLTATHDNWPHYGGTQILLAL